MAQVLGLGDRCEHDPGAGDLGGEGLDRRSDRRAEDVVGQHHEHVIVADELLGQAQRLGDPAGALLVGVEQKVDAILLAVGQQAEELTRMRAAGDDHHLRDSGDNERLDRVRDHRAIPDGQQVLVGYPCQRVEAAAGPTCQ